jgi:hypothetical protein
VKGGGVPAQHNQTQSAPVVRTGIKASGYALSNHSQSAVVVRTCVKAGGSNYTVNHNQTQR